ncbi:MAG TPA: acyl-CoA dehydratase activase [Thermotogota bacterium]|nr:2-hydroxyacyl-CoA dehydratase [Thermotogota bacterium]NLH18495.1 3-hydroxyacyl-ACP dehydratase [Thermotogaceae bacterium]OQC31663.1 MAG: R-phenyllactate dehydratase activator [Thermotogota bacterium ADurb.Bin062]HNW47795.1 acyl-CoA dehydratase activase [Thermotogota bacterium]HNY81468.1 acyl-CoA dehydratase activase [Thermotogota bacterium]
MIGYLCKYTPVEILHGFSETFERIEPITQSVCCADGMLHPNLCSYARAVLETCLEKKITGLVLTNCCDSVRRLYDVALNDPRFTWVEFIDLPRKHDASAVAYFEGEVHRFLERARRFFPRSFNEERFFRSIPRLRPSNPEPDPNPPFPPVRLALTGARIHPDLKAWFMSYPVSIVADTTCTNPDRGDIFQGEISSLKTYARALLNQTPCMRMNRAGGLAEPLLRSRPEGIVYQTVKFCDFYGYDYALLRGELEPPLLKIETDYTTGSVGQLKTRFEAFLESILARREPKKPSSIPFGLLKGEPEMRNDLQKLRVVAGIDVGSTSVNVVLMDENHRILATSIVKTGPKSGLGARNALDEALATARLSLSDIRYIVSTGYGRAVASFSHEAVTEITCHARGALWLDRNVRTVIDIGGQDSKVMRIDSNGELKDFVMNDKCAAGTGKFLEMMARTLELEIEDLGPASLRAKEKVMISSMCTVFAESEVISLIAQNKETPDIIKGLCDSVATRTAALVSRVGKEERVMMTGGVAKNVGVVNSLSERLQTDLVLPPEPQIVGAIGAALIALERGHPPRPLSE